MKPSPYQIAAFTHAARERSVSRAAAVLGVTQSSVTQHVANLERIMGTRLFVRRREGLDLTHAGRELFDISDRIRNLEQLIEEKVQDYGDLSHGHLRIIANTPRPVMPLIARYTQRFPHVQIEFTLFSWRMAMQRLQERDVDVAIVVEPEITRGLHATEIATNRLLAHMRRDHPLASRESVTLADLAEHMVVLPEDGSLTQEVVNRKVVASGITLPRVIKMTTYPVAKEAILHGVGVGLMLEDSQFPAAELVTIEVVELDEVFRVYLVTPSDKRDLRLVRSFREVALEDVSA